MSYSFPIKTILASLDNLQQTTLPIGAKTKEIWIHRNLTLELRYLLVPADLIHPNQEGPPLADPTRVLREIPPPPANPSNSPNDPIGTVKLATGPDLLVGIDRLLRGKDDLPGLVNEELEDLTLGTINQELGNHLPHPSPPDRYIGSTLLEGRLVKPNPKPDVQKRDLLRSNDIAPISTAPTTDLPSLSDLEKKTF